METFIFNPGQKGRLLNSVFVVIIALNYSGSKDG
tara:strand:+ start:703 stop:804 length:102 start_codon:yes stop_codon:yes gene_type:complete